MPISNPEYIKQDADFLEDLMTEKVRERYARQLYGKADNLGVYF
jgi:hypothetical protein